ANKSNQKCICQACMNAVGREFALKDDNLKITNTKCYCANHLRDYEKDEDKNDSTSRIISSNSLASSNTLKKQTTLSKYVGRSLTASEISKFECLVLRATVSAGFAFWWIENPEELIGVVFITSSGETLIWEAEDISIERQRQEEVINRIYAPFNQAKELDIRVNCLVTDSARFYAAARYFLRHEICDKVFIPCFAHQVNCCVRDIFKESTVFKNTSKCALHIVSFFYYSVYFMAKLYNEQISVLKKYINFITPSITRWNSHFECFDSVLKNKHLLKTLVTKDDVASDNDLKLSTEIKIAINHDSF
ncbi:21994_t:CDS:2, partial [Cetraspora pellucida]